MVHTVHALVDERLDDIPAMDLHRDEGSEGSALEEGQLSSHQHHDHVELVIQCIQHGRKSTCTRGSKSRFRHMCPQHLVRSQHDLPRPSKDPVPSTLFRVRLESAGKVVFDSRFHRIFDVAHPDLHVPTAIALLGVNKSNEFHYFTLCASHSGDDRRTARRRSGCGGARIRKHINGLSRCTVIDIRDRNGCRIRSVTDGRIAELDFLHTLEAFGQKGLDSTRIFRFRKDLRRTSVC